MAGASFDTNLGFMQFDLAFRTTFNVTSTAQHYFLFSVIWEIPVHSYAQIMKML
jgi:hypothetical protein